jgi:aryl-alcohol dehydrogenase-like predicted oxidoreductase
LIGNLEVSEVGVGCMGFSHGYGKVPEEAYSIKAIQKAHDFGCTFFDTAEGYGDVVFHRGHNEQLLGKAIEGFRKDIVLATKFRVNASEIGDGVTIQDAIRKHLDSSLKNLKTSYIDLYYLHRIDNEVPFEDVAEALGAFIKEGVIRGWGLSQVSGETLAKAHAVTPLTAVQNLYNMLERDCEKDIFPFCLENNIGVVPFSPTASGFLSGNTPFEKVDDVRNWVLQLAKENFVANQPVLDILAEFSEKKNATNAQISLAWMLHKYPNVVPIPGSKTQDRILENLGSSDVVLTKEEFAELEAALDKCVVFGHRGHVESDQNNFGNNWKKK